MAAKQQTPIYQTAAFATAGCLFGLAMYKAGVYRVDVIRSQFNFSCNIMLKMFLSATGTSTLTIGILHKLGFTKRVSEIENHDRAEKYGGPSVMVGGFCLGAGMALGGACPGMLPIQMAAGNTTTGAITLLGAMAGVIVFTAINEHITPLIECGNFAAADPNKKAVHTMLFNGAKHKKAETPTEIRAADTLRFTTALGLAALYAGMVAAVDYLSPGTGALHLGAGHDAIVAAMWHPALCGVIIGSLQLLLVPLCDKPIGSSGAYSYAMGVLAQPFVACNALNAKFCSALASPGKRGQLVYITASVAFIAALAYTGGEGTSMGALRGRTSLYPYNPADLSPTEAFVGGFLMLFGSRVASGCTSGHGISGAGSLHTKSFIAIVTMFLGGIVTAYVNPQW
eukprot:m.586373 g.586373  ORF g.586373 m.586373 type:complete len:397 (-) comp22342_c1_seq7:6999-8189(-)